MKLPELILDDLRWKAGQAVINPFGESVYLKQVPNGLTDCCSTDDPCGEHAEAAA